MEHKGTQLCIGFTRFTQEFESSTRGGMDAITVLDTHRERGEGGRAAHQRGEEASIGWSPEHGGRRWGKIASEGRKSLERAGGQRAEERKGSLGLGQRTFFKNT
jgi:hypothetical protein